MSNKKILNQSSWDNYYSEHKAGMSNIILHAEYIFTIMMYRPKSILEIGCGPADHSMFIKKILPNIKLYLLDLDERLLNRVEGKYKGQFEKAYHMDILDTGRVKSLPKIDIIISQGLLEHFEDKEFAKIINNFASRGEKMIASIPSNVYQHRDFGNEILRSKSEIKDLLNKTCPFEFKVRAPLDPGFRTKMQLIKENKPSILKALQLLVSKSCHLIITINYQKPRALTK